jgi:hypothetical protein
VNKLIQRVSSECLVATVVRQVKPPPITCRGCGAFVACTLQALVFVSTRAFLRVLSRKMTARTSASRARTRTANQMGIVPVVPSMRRRLFRVSKAVNDIIFTIGGQLFMSRAPAYCRIDCWSYAIDRESGTAVLCCASATNNRRRTMRLGGVLSVGDPLPLYASNRLTASGSYRLMIVYCLAA